MNLALYKKIFIKRLSKINPKWEKDPFPYTVIDNFLPEKLFKKINLEFEKKGILKDKKKKFETHVELNKTVYGDKDLNQLHQLPIKLLGGDHVKNLIQQKVGKINITSLTKWKDYGGYYPFHSMGNGGVLGSHVDHSHSKYGDLHIANSIYYSSSVWKKSWGGETVLFNSSGLMIKKKIFPKPNRLIIFIHSALSFHGVKFVKSPKDRKRSTYYMDYYINDKNLNTLEKNLKKNNLNKIKYTFHSTSFLPLFPLGISSFKLKSLFQKNTYPYFIIFIKYLVTRFFLNYNFIKRLKR